MSATTVRTKAGITFDRSREQLNGVALWEAKKGDHTFTVYRDSRQQGVRTYYLGYRIAGLRLGEIAEKVAKWRRLPVTDLAEALELAGRHIAAGLPSRPPTRLVLLDTDPRSTELFEVEARGEGTATRFTVVDDTEGFTATLSVRLGEWYQPDEAKMEVSIVLSPELLAELIERAGPAVQRQFAARQADEQRGPLRAPTQP